MTVFLSLSLRCSLFILFYQGVEGTKQWLPVTYERLPTFCFLCGILGHGEVNCPKRYEEGFVEPEEGLPHGQWLRVIPDLKEQGVTLPRLPRAGPSRDGPLSQRAIQRSGSQVFEFGTNRSYKAGLKENVHPNESWRLNGSRDDARSISSFSALDKQEDEGVTSRRKRV